MNRLPTQTTHAPLRIALVGGRGRTGRAIVAAAAEQGVVISAIIGRHDDLNHSMDAMDVILDFSAPEITSRVVQLARDRGKPLVIGTTGHSPEERQVLLQGINGLPVVWSGNYSIGVNLMFALTQQAIEMLGTDCDCEIIEAHHRFKKDAPSGTATRLVEIVQAARGLGTEQRGRVGTEAVRRAADIGVHAVRGGDVIGDHTVVLAGIGERLELAHRASDRTIFARGALRAAHWICRRTAGLYSMQDVHWSD